LIKNKTKLEDKNYEKRNLEIGDSTDSISSHRSSYHAWRNKLRVIARSGASLNEK